MYRRDEAGVVAPHSSKSLLLQAITWLLLAMMTLSVVMKVVTKRFLIRRLGYDDLLTSVALVSERSGRNDPMFTLHLALRYRPISLYRSAQDLYMGPQY